MFSFKTKVANVLYGAACFMLLFHISCSKSPLDPDDSGDRGDGPVDPVLSDSTEFYTYQIVNQYPHDPDAFTQGLVLDNDTLFEGTGLRGSSTLRRVDLITGAVLQQHDLESRFFGEGITVFEDRIIQLTWTSRTGFVYDKVSFTQQQEFSYDTEGWGITHDGTNLIMSDGSATLYFLDPETFEKLDEVSVRYEDEPVRNLNELEYIENHIFANVWLTDRIAIINPVSGEVVSWLDLAGLLPANERAAADVLNGIAFDSDTNHLLVTGKLWPRLFEIMLVPENEPLLLADSKPHK